MGVFSFSTYGVRGMTVFPAGLAGKQLIYTCQNKSDGKKPSFFIALFVFSVNVKAFEIFGPKHLI